MGEIGHLPGHGGARRSGLPAIDPITIRAIRIDPSGSRLGDVGLMFGAEGIAVSLDSDGVLAQVGTPDLPWPEIELMRVEEPFAAAPERRHGRRFGNFATRPGERESRSSVLRVALWGQVAQTFLVPAIDRLQLTSYLTPALEWLAGPPAAGGQQLDQPA